MLSLIHAISTLVYTDLWLFCFIFSPLDIPAKLLCLSREGELYMSSFILMVSVSYMRPPNLG